MQKCKPLLSIKRIILLILALSIAFLGSCRKREASAYDMLSRFMSEYGVEAVIYTLSAPEGSLGAFSTDMFYTMYSADTSRVFDFALIMLSRSVSLSECAVFVCYSVFDAMEISEVCRRRLDLFSSATGIDIGSYTEDAFVMRRKNIVVLCAMRDNKGASVIWSGILDFY